jgi:hypothetical protein
MWITVKPESMLVDLRKRGTRTISSTVISGRVSLPPLSDAENDKWSEHIGGVGFTEIGAIANFGEKTELITPVIQRAIDDWLWAQNIRATRRYPAVPLACTGTGFHHDANDYYDQIFCVVWLSEDTPWDVYFPFIDKRIRLEYGAIFVFDSGQPHGVVPHGATKFDFDTFEYQTGVFASQDLVINRACRSIMGIEKYSRKGQPGRHILERSTFREELDPETGKWSIEYFKDRA